MAVLVSVMGYAQLMQTAHLVQKKVTQISSHTHSYIHIYLCKLRLLDGSHRHELLHQDPAHVQFLLIGRNTSFPLPTINGKEDRNSSLPNVPMASCQLVNQATLSVKAITVNNLPTSLHNTPSI